MNCKKLTATSLLFLFLFSALPASQGVCAEKPSASPVKIEAKKHDVYRTVPPDKSLFTSPQFVVIDDFNTGKIKSDRGVFWQVKAPAAGALDLEMERMDARNPDRGYSLKAKFKLLPGEEASLQSLLPTLDVSQAQYLIFQYRVKTNEKHNFKGHLELELTDWKHQKATHVLEELNTSAQNWQEAIYPISLFQGLDLDQVFSIKFILKAQNEKIEGTLSIDEVAFFGFNDIAFESNRDNLVGYPKTVQSPERLAEIRKIKNDKKFIKEIAKDTWKFFENARDKKTSLIVDHLGLGETPFAADYTSPTNMAMDLLATISAMDLEFISSREAEERVMAILAAMKNMRRYKKFFYNFYNTKTLTVTRSYISSVDSGWLAIALVVVRQAFPGTLAAKQATEFLDSFSFGEFLDPENNQLVLGFDVPERNFGGYHYGMFVSEARATSFYGIGKGNLPREHWWFLYRTPPTAWNWQNQKPKGETKTYEGMEVFQGYYEKDGKRFVPSWGGSLFEFLMPTLVIDEKKLAPKGLGLNNKIATEMQRDYALKEKKYPVWGISPSATVDGRKWRYAEYGVKTLSVKGYPDHQIMTPHVSFLALETLPDDAVENIRNFLQFDIYGEYGLYDSVNLRTRKVNQQYLALDQGMSLVAMCNYLTKGSIKKRFHEDFN